MFNFLMLNTIKHWRIYIMVAIGQNLNLYFPTTDSKVPLEARPRFSLENFSIISTPHERDIKEKADDFFASLLGSLRDEYRGDKVHRSGYMHSIATIFRFWEEELPQIIHLYKIPELVDLYSIFALSCAYPSNKSLDLIEKRMRDVLDDISLEELSELCSSLASLGRNLDNYLLDRIIRRIDDYKSDMCARDLCNAFFFLTVMSVLKNATLPTPLMYEIRGRLESLESLENSEYAKERRIIQFSAYFGLACPYKMPQNHDNGSNLEKRVTQVFNDAGYPKAKQPKELEYIGGGLVDLPLEHKQHRFQAEIDGPVHFVHQFREGQFVPAYISGDTIIRTAVNKRLCPQDFILSLPKETCRYLVSLEGREAAPEILPRLFDDLINVEPEAYFIDLDYPEDGTNEPNLLAVEFFDLIRN